MKSTFGNQLVISLFGESHGEAVGCVIDGLPAGIEIDLNFLQGQMDKRRAKGSISTGRREADEVRFISGVFEGHTTGTPICLLIKNADGKSGDYQAMKSKMRPSHADWAAQMKYGGFQDYRGGGHFSGRLTAPIVAAGAICLTVLRKKGILVGTHILQCYNVFDTSFLKLEDNELLGAISRLNQAEFPVLEAQAAVEMTACIESAGREGDSVGGILESAVVGMPSGVGEPFFHSVESRLSALLYSIPAVKGVSFGLGFDFAGRKGSEANDSLYYGKTGEVRTRTNHNGGINGGISNGMPLLIQSVVKPTPSIYKRQQSIDIETKENISLSIQGRHDPAILHRARVVADSMIALGLVDLFMQRYGYLWAVRDE